MPQRLLLRDHSGRADDVNVDLLDLLVDNGYTPVLTMPLIDQDGHAVNSENDDVVAALHRRKPARQIVFLVEAPGLLTNPDDPTTAIPNLTREEIRAQEQRASGRMARKLRSIRGALEASPTRITIADGRSEHPLVDAIAGRGTVIQ